MVNALIVGAVGRWFGARLTASPADIAGEVIVVILASAAVLGIGYASAAIFMLIHTK